MTHCPECGEEVIAGEKICPHCGAELEKGRPTRSRLPKLLHPFAVAGYLAILSVMIVFFQFLLQAGKAGTAATSEAVIAEQAASLISRFRGKPPVPKTPADKRYVEILRFEQSANPFFQKLIAIDTEFSKPDYRPSESRYAEVSQDLAELSSTAENFTVPNTLGPCRQGIKNSIDEAKRAVNFLRNYQTSPSPTLKSDLEQSWALSRSQRNYCQSMIELVKKKLEADLSLNPDELKRAAEEPVPPPTNAPPPAPEPAAPPANAPPATAPSAYPNPYFPPLGTPGAEGRNPRGQQEPSVDNPDEETGDTGEEPDEDNGDTGGDYEEGDTADESQ